MCRRLLLVECSCSAAQMSVVVTTEPRYGNNRRGQCSNHHSSRTVVAETKVGMLWSPASRDVVVVRSLTSRTQKADLCISRTHTDLNTATIYQRTSRWQTWSSVWNTTSSRMQRMIVPRRVILVDGRVIRSAEATLVVTRGNSKLWMQKRRRLFLIWLII